jgi:hypothetical protein
VSHRFPHQRPSLNHNALSARFVPVGVPVPECDRPSTPTSPAAADAATGTTRAPSATSSAVSNAWNRRFPDPRRRRSAERSTPRLTKSQEVLGSLPRPPMRKNAPPAGPEDRRRAPATTTQHASSRLRKRCVWDFKRFITVSRALEQSYPVPETWAARITLERRRVSVGRQGAGLPIPLTGPPPKPSSIQSPRLPNPPSPLIIGRPRERLASDSASSSRQGARAPGRESMRLPLIPRTRR